MKWWILGLFVANTAWAGKRPQVIDDALAFAASDRDKAAQMLEAALSDETLEDEARAQIEVYAGEQRRLAGDKSSAKAHFDRAVSSKSQGDAAQLGLLLIGTPTNEQLTEIPEKPVLATQNADRYLLLAIEATKAGDVAGVREHSKKALSYAKADEQVLLRVRERLESVAQGDVEPPLTKRPLEQAEEAYAAGKTDRAREFAQQVIDHPENPAFTAAAKYLIQKIDKNTVVRPDKIGVLLPLTGKYGAVGAQIREALELGYGSASTQRKLVVVDAGDTTESSIAALEKLVLVEGVIAVLGPVRSEGADEVAAAADALRVPLIGLSQAVGTQKGRTWVFEGMVNPQTQIEALLDVAMGQRQMKAFGTFAPDNTYGHTAAQVFRETVEARGGSITVEQFYDPEATDLIPFAKKLGRKDYTARQSELYKLRSEAKANGGDPSKVVLPPTIDFDALFIPDNAQRVPIACAGLAYEEFPIGQFKPRKSSTTFPLMGLSGWNSDTLMTRGGQYVLDSLFADAWYRSTPEDTAFDAKYRASTGRAPTPLEAVVHDLGALLASAARSSAKDPAAFRDALIAATAPGSVTGTTGFSADKQTAKHSVRVLTIRPDGIFPWDAQLPVP